MPDSHTLSFIPVHRGCRVFHRAGTLRPAGLDDILFLEELERSFPGDRLTRRHFRYLLTRANADVFIHESEDRIVADMVILYRHGSRTARLYSLVVHPDYRGKGIARGLLSRAEDAAAARGCSSLRLEVRADNHAAQRLYRQCGYGQPQWIESYYEDRSPALCLRKPVVRAIPPGNRAGVVPFAQK